MCGFVGLSLDPGPSADSLRSRVRQMTDRIHHRGPDDEGIWVDEEVGVALGFRRLAILDLSPLGAQPMASSSGRFIMAFNGEIYNFVELGEELARKGHTFRGRSDTEVALAAIEEWGFARALDRFVGMFAIALWDRTERTLSLARDRLGIKPLYYFWQGGTLLFGSEIKALRADPSFDSSMDPSALQHFLRYLYVPSPLSIFRHVRKLPPGHLLEIGRLDQPPPDPVCLWDLRKIARGGLNDPFPDPYPDLVSALDEQLSDAVRIRLRSDVPLGVLLSGGVDSTTVAAIAQSQVESQVKTYSIGFENPEHDESHHARAVAEYLGTDHHELFLTPPEILEGVPDCTRIFDEPFADPSQVPTLLVSRLARQEVTVALSGDGGDELFGGYNRYIAGPNLIRRISRVPRALRSPLGSIIGGFRPGLWKTALEMGGMGKRQRLLGEKAIKTATIMKCRSEWDMYLSLLGVGVRNPREMVLGTEEFQDLLSAGHPAEIPGRLNRMMAIDQLYYLPGDLLAKVDRASMSTSLEVRVPILDHRVAELSWRLPQEAKISGDSGKRILKDVLYRYIPRELVERPKVGFTPPTADWLRGPLKDWADDLLDQERIRRQGILKPESVQSHWRSFLKGRDDLALGVWALVQFQAWADNYS